jgi:tripeptidyl-peptidase-2
MCAELEVAVEQLKELQGQYDDAGPVFDAVVYHDGAVWRSVIDLEETGDLTSADVVTFTDYRREHQLGTFGYNSMLNFAVNIYEDGNVLSLVTSGTTHRPCRDTTTLLISVVGG